MKKFLAITITFFIVTSGMGQKITKQGHNPSGAGYDATYVPRDWDDNQAWVDGTNPGFTVANNPAITINGYVTQSDPDRVLQFNGGGPAHTRLLTIRDTLVVRGDMTMANNALNLLIAEGGILIVIGDFSTTNRINMENGGIFIVGGTMSIGGAQADYENSGSGQLYTSGPIGGANVPDGMEDDREDFDQLENDYPGLYDFVLSGGIGTLPVELLFFRGKATPGQVNLEWATATEKDFDYFQVERAGKNGQFEAIGYVQGQGNSSEYTAYKFTDNNPAPDGSYYRLKNIDLDRSFDYSEVITIDAITDTRSMEVYPNPVTQGRFTLKVNFELNSDAVIMIMDMKGHEVYRAGISGFEQEHYLPGSLTSGYYIVRVVSGGESHQERIVIR